MPRFPSAQGRLNHEPGFHLSCDEHLSEGWGPPLTQCGHSPEIHPILKARKPPETAV